MADRSTLHDQQYRPVSTLETAANDALSVRGLRDQAMNVNNAFARVCAPRLVDAWPGAQKTVAGNDTSEHVVWRFPPLQCGGPRGHYTHAMWGFDSFIGASSYNATLTLYSCERQYHGPDTITTALKAQLGAYSSGTLTADAALGDGDVDVVSSGEDGLLLNPAANGETYFLLTATFSDASANNIVTLLGLTITLVRTLADIETADIL